MDIMELGAVGELIGGVAVLATLVYLALQVGQNVKQLRVDSLQAAVIGYAERIEGILGDEDRLDAFWKGLAGDANMSRTEKAKFHGIMIGNLSVFENNLNLYRAGILPKEQIVVHEYDVVSILNSPGATIWWDQVKDYFFSTSFKQHVDRTIEEIGPEIAALSDKFAQIFGDWEAIGEASKEGQS